MEDPLNQNRREHLRFKLTTPVYAQLGLWRVRRRDISSRSQSVLLNNISLGGCQFATNLLLPVREDVQWLLKLRLGHYSTNVRLVIRYRGTKEGLNIYGGRWVMTGLERQTFQYRLDEYLRTVLISSPHIHTLYRKIAERGDDGRFKRLDVTS